MGKKTEPHPYMELWDGWPTVPKKHLKPIPGMGNLTSISATYQCQEATRRWGPYGYKWGVRSLSYQTIHDSGRITTIVATGEFFYPVNDETACFPVAADMEYRWAPTTKESVAGKVKDDIWKKLMTELQSKGLLKLGFGSELAIDTGKHPRQGEDDYSGDEQRQRSHRPGGSEYDPSTDERLITEKQSKRIFAVAKHHGVDTRVVKTAVLEVCQTEHTKEIKRCDYDKVIAAVMRQGGASEEAIFDSTNGREGTPPAGEADEFPHGASA